MLPSSEYRPGQNIAGTQYRFVKALGYGGHGSVYAVEHTFLEAPAVMKLLHAELALETNLAQRMTREARTLAKLRHPNIVEVRDGGLTSEDPPRPFFVMESLNGMSLRELVKHMRGRGIGVLPALRIINGVFEGLHHAHSAGVIHRDVKPDNIFLHRTSTDVTIPKILDFGIAHLLVGRRFTGNCFVGTPRYASPEQLLGDKITVATDIYSAGLVLYELITGRAPYFEKRDLAPLLEAHLKEKLPRVSIRARDATPEVDALVELLLEKDPTKRPATAFAAAVAVRELRTLIESQQNGKIHDVGFKTDPTPIENFLVEAGPSGIELVTDDNLRGPERTLLSPVPLSTPPRPVPVEETTAPLLRPATPPASIVPPSIDRGARTRTAQEIVARRRPIGGDTVPFSFDSSPGTPISTGLVYSSPPSPPPRPSIPVPASIDFAEMSSSIRPAPPSRTVRHRLSAKPMVVFALALVLFCGFGVPVAVSLAKRYAPRPPTTSTTTALSAPIESPRAIPTPAPVPTPVPAPTPTPLPAPSSSTPTTIATPPEPLKTPHKRTRGTPSSTPTTSSPVPAPVAPSPAPAPAPPRKNPGDPNNVPF